MTIYHRQQGKLVAYKPYQGKRYTFSVHNICSMSNIYSLLISGMVVYTVFGYYNIF